MPWHVFHTSPQFIRGRDGGETIRGMGKTFRYSCSSADRRALDTSSSAVFQMLSCLTPIRTYDKFGQTFAQTFSWLVYLSNIL
jgi:hypothetical protein